MKKAITQTYMKRSVSEQREIMRKNILLAFECLLQDSSYIEIGVNKICSEAHISKPTFYRYFQSKEDIVRWLSKEAIRCGVAEVGRKYTWTEGYLRTLMVIDHYRGFYADPKGPAITNPLSTFCSDFLKLVLFETLTKYKGTILTKKLSFQIEAFVQIQSYLLQQWGAKEMLLDAKTYADYLSSVVPHDLYISLEEPTDFIVLKA